MPGEETIFDDVFRTIAEKMPRLLIPLINLTFGTEYPEDVPLTTARNEHMTKSGKVITDSVLLLDGVSYHVECESKAGNVMVMVHRMLEYDFAIAFEKSMSENKAVLQLPSSCVVYLRHTRNTPDCLRLTIRNAEGDTIPYRVPVVKAQAFSMEKIFENRLLLLLPFYILRHQPRFPQIEADPEARESFFSEMHSLMLGLDRSAIAAEAEKTYQYADLCKLAARVADYLLENYEQTREGVKSIMRGKVLELWSEQLLREGREEGLAEGREEGQIISFAGLVRDELLTLPEAAKRCGMTPETFAERAQALGCPV